MVILDASMTIVNSIIRGGAGDIYHVGTGNLSVTYSKSVYGNSVFALTGP